MKLPIYEMRSMIMKSRINNFWSMISWLSTLYCSCNHQVLSQGAIPRRCGRATGCSRSPTWTPGQDLEKNWHTCAMQCIRYCKQVQMPHSMCTRERDIKLQISHEW